MSNSGLLTLDAHGPLDADCLDDTPLLVCDRGHIAIAWRDWDGPRCPICARMGTRSGAIERAAQEAEDKIQESANNEVTEAENDLDDARDAIREAHGLLDNCFDVGRDTRGLVDAALGVLDRAV